MLLYRLFLVSLLLAVFVGCEQAPLDQDPAWVVEEFIDRMKAVHGGAARGRLALALMSKKSQGNLQERASRASAVTGRPVAAEEILVPSHFFLKFDPVKYQAEIKGNYARVTVTGDDPAEELAEVNCVKEESAWRVMFELPLLPPIQRRN